MKKCFKCGIEKSLIDFYQHKQMSDGHFGKCKECTKKDNAKRELYIKATPEGLEKERKRHRDKYVRLNYKEKQKEWDLKKPWKKSTKYKGLSKKLKIQKGFELHHWNYQDDYLEDIFIMKINEHRKSHRFLKIDIEKRLFMDLEGNLLKDKETHKNYLISKGIEF
jgi:hypothetical protein